MEELEDRRVLQAAPTPVGLEFVVHELASDGSDEQRFADVAMDQAGNFVVVWELFDDGNAKINARLFDPQGVPLTPIIAVTSSTVDEQTQPAVAMDDDGDFVVVWRTECDVFVPGSGSGSGYYAPCVEIRALRFDAAGTPQGNEFPVSPASAFDIQTNPDVAMDDSGDFVVVWSESYYYGFDEDVLFRRFSSFGDSLGSATKASASSADRQFNPTVAMDSDGDFVVAWEHEPIGSGTGPNGIFARQFDSLGVPAAAVEFEVDGDHSNDTREPAAGMDALGSFIIVWAEQPPITGELPVFPGSGGRPQALDIYARRYDSAGVPVLFPGSVVDSKFLVNTFTTGEQTSPAVSMNGLGEFAIVWHGDGTVGVDRNVYGQFYDAAGTPEGIEFLVNTTLAGPQQYPSVALNDNCQMVVVWDGKTDLEGFDASDVMAQRYSCEAVGSVDLVVLKTDSPDPVLVGKDVTYAVTVRNDGPDAASNVVLTDRLPAGVTFVSATGGVSPMYGTLTFNVGALAVNASATFEIVVRPNFPKRITNKASASASETDSNPANNTNIAQTTDVCGFEVTTTLDVVDPDDDLNSLREAILCANEMPNVDTTGDLVPDPDVITFNIPGAGVRTISPLTALPTIADPVVIDGYSQPGAAENSSVVGWNGTLLIELDGSLAGFDANGLHIGAGGSTVRGLVVNRFAVDGIHLGILGGNTIEGNFIGVDPTGTISRGNDEDGVELNGVGGNVIGGHLPSQRNVVSGNAFDGIYLAGPGATGNHLVNNYVGTNAAGTSALPNFDDGIDLDSAPFNFIVKNVSSGNDDDGLEIDQYDLDDGDAAGNIVQGNVFGANAAGNAAVPNGDNGVEIDDSSNNAIGGAAEGAANLISGNLGNGVAIKNADAAGNLVQANIIGVDRNGTSPLGNARNGVLISGASGNAVGGTSAGLGNVIAFNGTLPRGVDDNGVVVEYGSRNAIWGNSVFGNVGLGIDLDNDGVTPNDQGVPPFDADIGANDRQNFPVLASVARSGADTVVSGTLFTTPSTRFVIEFFVNDERDESGFGEGQTFLGSLLTEVSDANGLLNFSILLPGLIPAGRHITATATDPNNNTSEFSAAICSLIVTHTGDGGFGSLREAILCANEMPGHDTITLPAGTYLLAIAGEFEDLGATGDLDITDDLTIVGAGAGVTTVDGGELDRVFHVYGDVAVDFNGMTIRNGLTGGNGGGVLNEGDLTLANSVVAHNQADKGGGIYHLGGGELNVIDSTISFNVAAGNKGAGGGVLNNSGTVNVTRSTVANNTAHLQGGGLLNTGDSMTVVESTVSGNAALTGGGGGVFNRVELLMINSTVSGNRAAADGGGISNTGSASATLKFVTVADNVADDDDDGTGDGGGAFSSSDFALHNVIIGDNVDRGGEAPDTQGAFDSLGPNLVEDPSLTVIFGDLTRFIINQDPQLDPLAFNGGPTKTHAIRLDSPALDAAQTIDGIAVDQRGVSRPQGVGPDIGAFESTDRPVDSQAIVVVGADAGIEPRVKVYDAADDSLRFEFNAFRADFRGGVRVAVGDVNGDGAPDIVAGAGTGGGPHVRVFDGVTGAQLPGLIGSFYAYDPGFAGGVFVAAGDVNGDGKDDVITGADIGGGPHVKVFDARTGLPLTDANGIPLRIGSFYAYKNTDAAGVRVAAGDFDGDGRAEVVTGMGAGLADDRPVGGFARVSQTQVRVFSFPDAQQIASFVPFEAGYRGGVHLAVGQFDADDRAELIVGRANGDGLQNTAFEQTFIDPFRRAEAVVFDDVLGTPTQIAVFNAYPGFGGSVRVGAVNSLARVGFVGPSLLTGAGPSGGAHVKLRSAGLAAVTEFFAFDPAFLGGIYVAGLFTLDAD